MGRVIILEDDIIKTKSIRDYIESIYPNFSIECADSYNQGLRMLKNESYDVLILDMSMPTFSDGLATNETSFEKFAGAMILKEMKRSKRLIPTILFTMFDDFGSNGYSISLSQIDEELKNSYPGYYLGYVYFESGSSNWMTEVKKLIDGINFNR